MCENHTTVQGLLHHTLVWGWWSDTWLVGLTLIYMFHHFAQLPSRLSHVSIFPSRTRQTVEWLKSMSTQPCIRPPTSPTLQSFCFLNRSTREVQIWVSLGLRLGTTKGPCIFQDNLHYSSHAVWYTELRGILNLRMVYYVALSSLVCESAVQQ